MTVAWTQLALVDDLDVDHYVRDEVMVIDPRQTTNGERVRDLHRLGYLPEPVLDPTYGHGGMWTEYRPERLEFCDLNPDKSSHLGPVDFRNLPFSDNAFASVLYDPPYRYAGTPTQTDEGLHDERYGTDTYRTKAQITALVVSGAVECSRVAREFLIVKCADQVVTSRVTFQTRLVGDVLGDVGWELKDHLGLLSYRAQPAGRSQKNARQNLSWFLVFVPA